MTNSTEAPLLNISLPSEAHTLARQFAADQANSQWGKQIYLNTLAVYAVHTYLKWMAIDSDLESSYSWQSELQPLMNNADLFLPQIGRLECRPVLPGESVSIIPYELTGDRIGYIFVRLNESLDTANLLGFFPSQTGSEIPEINLTSLQPVEDLMDYLVPVQEQISIPQALVNLGQWLQREFESGWQTLDNLLQPGQTQLAFNFRNEPRSTEISLNNAPWQTARCREVLLEVEPQQTVIFLVAINAGAENRIDILLQVYPASNTEYLPADLYLAVLEENDQTFLEARSRERDNYIQLQFWGTPGERFKVRIQFSNFTTTEEFVI